MLQAKFLIICNSVSLNLKRKKVSGFIFVICLSTEECQWREEKLISISNFDDNTSNYSSKVAPAEVSKNYQIVYAIYYFKIYGLIMMTN